MIYMRAKGGEQLEAAIERAIQLAVHGNDIVHLVFDKTAIDIHPTWKDTAAQAWRVAHNHKISEAH